jgi:CBS domain-containing protein/sporulation protein YlmC with PRC-barrel domain
MPGEDPQMFLYFSELLGRTVRASGGTTVGRAADLKVRLGELYPKAGTLVVRRRSEKTPRAVGWDQVESLGTGAIVLRAGAERLMTDLEVGSDEILVREDLLDKQVVDTHGARIERINDVHLLFAHAELRLAHVDFGLRGILRRLGWLGPIDALSMWLIGSRIADRLASWKYVQPLASDPKRNLKLNVTLRRLRDMHPSDIADIIEDLSRANRSSVFRALDTETAAETLQEVDPRLQLSLIETAAPEKASDILESMEPDEAKEFLSDLPEEKMEHLIGTMEKPFRERVVGLMKHKEGTAGSIMTTDFLALDRDKTIGDAVEAFRIAIHPLETVAYIYVTDEARRLAGVVTLRHLLLCGKEEKLGALMNPRVLAVETGDGIGAVADVFNKYKFLAVPVVDAESAIQGIITLQDIVQATAEEL